MASLEPQILTCTNCDKDFDHNHAERMRALQETHEREQRHLWECVFLHKQFSQDSIVLDLYNSPWDDEPYAGQFCSSQCHDEYSEPFTQCQTCRRTICEHVKGLHANFRSHTRLGHACLRCYEREVLTCGQPREDYETDVIRGGMFFNHANPEPKNAGYTEVNGFKNYLVKSHQDANTYNEKARELIDTDHRVLTALERMAIGGPEGYITMFAKRGEDA